MDNQPKGIGFYNIKSGETRYAQLEAQIQGYINSSDIGINASRDQDFGWRLSPEWVKAVKMYRRNEQKMAFLTERNGGQKVTTTQVLYAIYGEQLRAAQERADENENPFEEEYLQAISTKPDPTLPEPAIEDADLDNLNEGADDGDSSEPSGSADGPAEPSDKVDSASASDKPANQTKKSNKK